jgi:adenosylcobinamide-phosphate synthase
MPEYLIIIAAAFLLDILIGDPSYALHPVRLIGRTIEWLEKTLYRPGRAGFVRGLILAIAVAAITLTFYLGTKTMLRSVHPSAGLTLDIFIVYSCIGFRELLNYAKSIAHALNTGELQHARNILRNIVGRDVERLDASEVATATIESVAENFVDGLLSPLFWFTVAAVFAVALGRPGCSLAVCGALLYRVVNTIDSMVGYRNERYIYFGRAGARLDDAMNFFPARIAIPIICLAAALCRLDATGCFKIGLRDRHNHASPNSGHTESCVAGALNIRLGGPVVYPYGLVEKPWLGDGNDDITVDHVRQSVRLILCAGSVSFAVSLLLLTFIS